MSDISNVVVCESAMPESQVEGYSGCWVCILSHRLSRAIQKRRIVAIDAGDEEWGTRVLELIAHSGHFRTDMFVFVFIPDPFYSRSCTVSAFFSF